MPACCKLGVDLCRDVSGINGVLGEAPCGSSFLSDDVMWPPCTPTQAQKSWPSQVDGLIRRVKCCASANVKSSSLGDVRGCSLNSR